jgi:NADH dehydrogenase
LIDRFNFHQFQPLFYQVATAGLDASNISFPLRKIFQNSTNVQVVLATLKGSATGSKTDHYRCRHLSYDYLVMATGCATNFFGNEQLEAYAYPMKSTVEALNIRHSIVENLELAARQPIRRKGTVTEHCYCWCRAYRCRIERHPGRDEKEHFAERFS